MQPPASCFQASLRCPLCLSPPDTVRLHIGFGKSWPLNPLFLFSIRTKAGFGYFLFLTFSGGSNIDDVIWKYNHKQPQGINSGNISTGDLFWRHCSWPCKNCLSSHPHVCLIWFRKSENNCWPIKIWLNHWLMRNQVISLAARSAGTPSSLGKHRMFRP